MQTGRELVDQQQGRHQHKFTYTDLQKNPHTKSRQLHGMLELSENIGISSLCTA